MNFMVKVICVDNKYMKTKLSLYKVYKVITSGDVWDHKAGAVAPAVYVYCDDKVGRWIPLRRFEEVQE